MLDSSDQAKNTFFERITTSQACRKNRHLPINHSLTNNLFIKLRLRKLELSRKSNRILTK